MGEHTGVVERAGLRVERGGDGRLTGSDGRGWVKVLRAALHNMNLCSPKQFR